MSPGRSETMRQALVEFMRGSSYRPATARDLMRLLRIDGTRRHEFKRTLRALLNDEEIVKVGRDRYAVPGRAGRDGGGRDTRPQRGRGRDTGGRRTERHGEPRPGRGQAIVTGQLHRHPRGFGFVTPDAGGPDVFVPPRTLAELLDGDRVAIRIVRNDGRGRAEGEIVRLLERTRKRVMGVFRSAGRGRGGTVQAYDRLFENGIDVAEEAAALHLDDLIVGIDLHPAHAGEVDCQSPVSDSFARDSVSTAPHGDLKLVPPGKVDGGGDVARSRDHVRRRRRSSPRRARR